MQEVIRRRRFIAGAVCPRCGDMDKIVIDAETDRRECIACGFSEERPGQEGPGQEGPGQEGPGQEGPGWAAPGSPLPAGQAGTPPARELPTRVSRPAARRVETPAEAVKLVDFDKPGR